MCHIFYYYGFKIHILVKILRIFANACFVALWFFWEGWLLKLGVFSDELQFRH